MLDNIVVIYSLQYIHSHHICKLSYDIILFEKSPSLRCMTRQHSGGPSFFYKCLFYVNSCTCSVHM